MEGVEDMKGNMGVEGVNVVETESVLSVEGSMNVDGWQTTGSSWSAC